MYSSDNNIIPTTNDEKVTGDWRKVALVFDTENYKVYTNSSGEVYGIEGFDYHWYVQNSDGTWSHKPGISPVTCYDNNNEIITNPFDADRGYYNFFAGYYKIRCDFVLSEAFQNSYLQSYVNDRAGDILQHSYSRPVEIQSSVTFLGRIEYGTGNLWRGLYYDSSGTLWWYIYSIDGSGTITRYQVRDSSIVGETELNFSVTDNESLSSFQAAERSSLYVSISSSRLSDSSDLPCDVDCFEFMVKSAGVYKIYTQYYSGSEAIDTYGILYNGTVKMACDDDNGDGNNFLISAELEPNVVYRVSVKANKSNLLGKYRLIVSKE